MSTIVTSCSSGLLEKLRSSGGWGPQELPGVAGQRAGCSFLGRPGWVGGRQSCCIFSFCLPSA